MVRSPFRYFLHLFKQDGQRLGAWPAEVDWEPAKEWALWQGMRRGELPAAAVGTTTIQPIWHARAGEPFVSGLRAAVTSNGHRSESELPLSYFTRLVEGLSVGLVSDGALQASEEFYYIVSAVPAEPEGDGIRAAAREIAAPLPLLRGKLARFLREATPSGPQVDGDPPVFLPQRILDEAVALVQASPGIETGGIFIGHLRRDPRPEIFAEITALVPAAHTEGSATRLHFCGATWAAARNAIDLRRRGEIAIGWIHSHPQDACEKCEKRREGACAGCGVYFSADDVVLHRTVFPRAYGVALVISPSAAGFAWAMFGWRNGILAERGFFISERGRVEATAEDRV
ncbi:MAG: Mov34/MPN/PAD-1 family protein [Planctomycetes bacterium]|nr:Mov34/MPN/PAD-1 family protein [Planctomycetota bacterium]